MCWTDSRTNGFSVKEPQEREIERERRSSFLFPLPSGPCQCLISERVLEACDELSGRVRPPERDGGFNNSAARQQLLLGQFFRTPSVFWEMGFFKVVVVEAFMD